MEKPKNLFVMTYPYKLWGDAGGRVGAGQRGIKRGGNGITVIA